ncbi:MAG: DUF445 family protein [Deltaproteobacteria bacterium]|nr:DUF445 family protein [Deltaproteobacteria bacterium]
MITDYNKYILPPVVGAIIGWFTNYVAIKMLFKPHRPVKVLGFTFQGLFPKRRKEIARSIATAIERELVSSKDIISMLDGIDWEGEVEKTVEEVIEHRFRSSKIAKIPIVSLISENLIYHVKYLITKDILAQIEKKREGISRLFSEKMNVGDMVTSRIDNFDIVKFEALLTEFIAQELRFIEWVGGVLGFIIGLFQTVIFYLWG